MQDDERDADTPPGESPDTEAHAFKWAAQDDGKGGKRLRQGWDPDSPPPGASKRTTKPETPKGR